MMNITELSYAVEVVDDDRENAFYIIASPGQDGQVPLTIVAVAVDGESCVLFANRVPNESVLPMVRLKLTGYRDNYFREPYGFMTDDHIEEVVQAVNSHFMIEEV